MVLTVAMVTTVEIFEKCLAKTPLEVMDAMRI